MKYWFEQCISSILSFYKKICYVGFFTCHFQLWNKHTMDDQNYNKKYIATNKVKLEVINTNEDNILFILLDKKWYKRIVQPKRRNNKKLHPNFLEGDYFNP